MRDRALSTEEFDRGRGTLPWGERLRSGSHSIQAALPAAHDRMKESVVLRVAAIRVRT